MAIKSILKCFELAYGLKVNFYKSKLGSIGVSLVMVKRFYVVLNCRTTNIPFTYLGLPANHKKKEFWMGTIISIRKRLARWKGRYISFAMRVKLIKLVISSISLYYMSLFKMPMSVNNIITRIQREILWGWGHEGRRIAWVKCGNIFKTKEEGGLGIKDLKMFNMALLGNGKWRLGKDELGLWKEVLLSKYGSWRALDKGIDGC